MKSIKVKGSEVEIRFCPSDITQKIEIFDMYFICAGVSSHRFAKMLGDRVNIYPVKGYSITLQLPDAISQKKAPKVSIFDNEAKIVTSRLGKHRFRVAGTAEISGHNLDILDAHIKPLKKWVEQNFSEVSTKDEQRWLVLRPMMPHMMPLISQGKKTKHLL